MNIATKLEKAAKLIEERGLTYGMLECGPNGPVCMLGAIQRVDKHTGDLNYPTRRNKTVQWLAGVIQGCEGYEYGDPGSIVFTWNDGHYGNKKASYEATEMLRKAAKKYREQA